MDTLVLKKETGRFSPKEILLTLKKGFGQCPMITEITPIGNRMDFKRTIEGKLVKIKRLEGIENLGLRDIQNMDKIAIKNRMLGMKSRKTLLLVKHCSISETKDRSKLGIISSNQSTANLNTSLTEAEAKDESVESLMNKQDRFVPNILRPTKMVKNIFDANSSIGFHTTQTMSSLNRDLLHNNQNLKQRRKQILRPLNIKHDSIRRTWIPRKKKALNRSSLRKCSSKSAKKNGRKVATIKTLNVEPEDNVESTETKAVEAADTEKVATDSVDSNDIYSADLEVFHQIQSSTDAENVVANSNDESIKQIFEEFKVADYENYIASEDRGFNIDEMDKLVSSDIDTISGIESSISYHSTEKVDYDENGNNIAVTQANVMSAKTNENHLRPYTVLSKSELYYEDESEPTINTSMSSKCDIDSDDGFCSDIQDDTSSFNTTEREFLSNDFKNFYHGIDELLSLIDTALESESNEFNSSQNQHESLLTEKNNFDASVTSVAHSDVPDNVFGNDYNKLCSDGLKPQPEFDFSPMIQQYDNNENIICNTSHMINISTNDGKLRNDFTPLEFLADGNFLVDNTLNINYSVLDENETCESILAKSNAKFDESESSNNISNNISDSLNESAQSEDFEDFDSGKSFTEYSSPVLIEREDTSELQPSKLGRLLTLPRDCKDYRRDYMRICNPSHDLETECKIIDNEHHSSIHMLGSPVSSNHNYIKDVIGCQNYCDASQGHTLLERSLTGQNRETNFDDVNSRTEKRNDHLSKIGSLHNPDSYECSSTLCPLSSEIPSPSDSLSDNLNEPQQGVCEGAANSSEVVAPNVNCILCKSCNKPFSSEVDLAHHMKDNHRYQRLRCGRKDKKYVCDKCSKQYCLAKAIETHSQLHDDYILTCKICGKHFSERVHLQRHINSYHLNKKFHCLHCNRKYANKNTLLSHLKIHHGEKQIAL